MTHPQGALSLLLHPYEEIEPFTGGRRELRAAAGIPGTCLVWSMGSSPGDATLVEKRPGGLALIVILPDVEDIRNDANLIMAVQRCRPHGILPYHTDPRPEDLAQVMRRPPADLAAEVTDYISWRGLGVDRETIRLIRQILELSGELRSVTALSRGMYVSRRALGRRLMKKGLPVPSHWLQIGRLLRLAVRLQNSDASLFSLACDSGYPDGFSVSNQMYRLIGYRPSQVRDYLGWEWLFEEWLRREAESGGLSPIVEKAVCGEDDPSTRRAGAPPARAGRPTRSKRTLT